MKNNNEFILDFCKSIKNIIVDYVSNVDVGENTPKILIHASYIAGVYGTMMCIAKQYIKDIDYDILVGYVDTAKYYYHTLQCLANDYMESLKNDKEENENE